MIGSADWETTTLAGRQEWTYLGHAGDEILVVRGANVAAFMLGGADEVGIVVGNPPEGSYVDLGAGNDSVLSGEGRDVLIGRQGDDFLAGSGGEDILDGGEGAGDILHGGDGVDTTRDPDGAHCWDPDPEVGYCGAAQE
jgi:serralysin